MRKLAALTLVGLLGAGIGCVKKNDGSNFHLRTEKVRPVLKTSIARIWPTPEASGNVAHSTIVGYDLNDDNTIDEAFISERDYSSSPAYSVADSIVRTPIAEWKHLVASSTPTKSLVYESSNTRTMTPAEQATFNAMYFMAVPARYKVQK